jgi:hypothetical protein
MHRFHDQSTAGKLSRRNLFRLGAGGALAASVSACASPDRGPAVPLGRTKEASVLGLDLSTTPTVATVAGVADSLDDSSPAARVVLNRGRVS